MILRRLSRLAQDFLRAATTVEQRSLATELMELTASLDPDALAGEINSSIQNALQIAGNDHPYRN